MPDKKDGNRKKQEKPEIDVTDIEALLKSARDKETLLNVPKTLLKKEEWGLLTVLTLLLASVFPVYFVNIMLITFFTELGHLFTTHINEVERQKLIDFEKEFRLGYDKEKESKWGEAVEIYMALAEKHKKNPKIAVIAEKRIEWVRKNYLSKGK
jgi:hypothetical protein